MYRAEFQAAGLVSDGFRSRLSTFGSEFGIVPVLSHDQNLVSDHWMEGLDSVHPTGSATPRGWELFVLMEG